MGGDVDRSTDQLIVIEQHLRRRHGLSIPTWILKLQFLENLDERGYGTKKAELERIWGEELWRDSETDEDEEAVRVGFGLLEEMMIGEEERSRGGQEEEVGTVAVQQNVGDADKSSGEQSPCLALSLQSAGGPKEMVDPKSIVQVKDSEDEDEGEDEEEQVEEDQDPTQVLRVKDSQGNAADEVTEPPSPSANIPSSPPVTPTPTARQRTAPAAASAPPKSPEHITQDLPTHHPQCPTLRTSFTGSATPTPSALQRAAPATASVPSSSPARVSQNLSTRPRPRPTPRPSSAGSTPAPTTLGCPPSSSRLSSTPTPTGRGAGPNATPKTPARNTTSSNEKRPQQRQRNPEDPLATTTAAAKPPATTKRQKTIKEANEAFDKAYAPRGPKLCTDKYCYRCDKSGHEKDSGCPWSPAVARDADTGCIMSVGYSRGPVVAFALEGGREREGRVWQRAEGKGKRKRMEDIAERRERRRRRAEKKERRRRRAEEKAERKRGRKRKREEGEEGEEEEMGVRESAKTPRSWMAL